MVAAPLVVVGASIAGLTTAEALRAEGYAGPITVVGDERHPPYLRPPLSKKALADPEWSHADAALYSADVLAAFDLDHVEGRATGLELPARVVLVGERRIPFDRLVIATGVSPRRLAGTAGLAGVHALRTLDDVAGLRRELVAGARVTVIGSGVLGMELAAAGAKAGAAVTLIGRSAELRLGSAGTTLSPYLAELLRAGGVDLRLGVQVLEVRGAEASAAERTAGGRVTAVVLADGTSIDTDVLVVAIGTTPNVEWLRGSGLDLDDGVLCDSTGMAAPDVYAVGDVARWRDPLTGVAVRIEHQLSAIEQAHAVAKVLVTGQPSAPVVPFFWSELFGSRILVHGEPGIGNGLTVVAGDPAGGRFVASASREGRVVGLVGWNMPREFRTERAALLAEATARLPALHDAASPTARSSE